MNPWPTVWVVEGVHGSKSAHFNRETAERHIAERAEPQKYTITEYAPAAGDPGGWRACFDKLAGHVRAGELTEAANYVRYCDSLLEMANHGKGKS